MENATKALTIAGGILIAIIVIATLWYSFQQWGIFPSQKDESEETAQLIEFNNGFESYYKQNLYGADVITVLNKAIANNDKYRIALQPNDPYFVDVEFRLLSPVTGYTITTTIDPRTKEVETNIVYDTTALVSSDKTYSLRNPNDLEIAIDLCSESPVNRRKTSPTQYVETYQNVEEFKQRYFTCTEIATNPENGRVFRIVFKEILEEIDGEGNFIKWNVAP